MDSDLEESEVFHAKPDFSDAKTPILPASERVVGEPKFPLLVLRFLDAARCSGRYTDMVMRTSAGEFHVHRLVMAAVSRTVASENMTDRNYSLFTHNGPNVKTSHTALAAIIEFAYSGKTRLNVENVEGVLSLAIHFQISFLITACQEFIVEHMSESTIIKFLDFSAGYPLNIIKARVFRYMHDNLKYLLTDRESRLLNVASPAIAEFMYHEETGGSHRQDNEGKLELAIRYFHENDHLDKEDEAELVEAVKTLISGMSDNGLGRCLTKMPQLLFKDKVRRFLLQTGICLKNMSSPGDGENTPLDKSPPPTARSKKAVKDHTYNRHHRKRYPANSPSSDFVTNPLKNESFCNDLKSYQRRRQPSVRTSHHRYNKSHNKSPQYYNHIHLGNSSFSETDQDTNRVICISNGPDKSPTTDKHSADISQLSTKFDTLDSLEATINASKPITQNMDWMSRPIPKKRYSTSMRPQRHHYGNSPTFNNNCDQPWSDSPRFANEEFEKYPDLEPLPDARTRLAEISLFYNILPDDRATVGGLRLTYFHRRPRVNYFRVKDIGVVPKNPRRYDVVKLKDNQWISGVGLGVSDVVHWISFYTSDKRMFGPFGHEGGQSVRVEAPAHKPELYGIHCTTRTRGSIDVLANMLFRWIRPP